MKLIYGLILLSVSVGAVGSVFAAEAEKEKAAPAKQEQKSAGKEEGSEVDISDIQNQYWKAHDKEFEVIQNKLYTKSGRVELAPMFGWYQRAEFQDTKTVGGALAYHFTEFFGLELMAYKMLNSDSSTLKRFKETRGATIEFNQEKYYAGLSGMFTPIYGKFSLFGKKISHFDLYISPNLGVTKTIDNRFTYGVGIGQKFWVSPRWNVRLEYRWMHYTDKTPTTEGATAVKNGGPGYFEDSVNNQNLMFGVSFLF